MTFLLPAIHAGIQLRKSLGERRIVTSYIVQVEIEADDEEGAKEMVEDALKGIGEVIDVEEAE